MQNLGETMLVRLNCDWTDPDPDSAIVSLKPGDNLPTHGETFRTTAGRHFTCGYQYHLPDPLRSRLYSYELKLDDRHGGADTFRSSVRVP